jgi:hypothetical protein
MEALSIYRIVGVMFRNVSEGIEMPVTWEANSVKIHKCQSGWKECKFTEISE